ncbi:hypothetical protein BD769DRAFT_1667255 [Suillus cothurnatus]|nr:hypothetical protein BD769DRAFT_1667255 [Suillus cothurnatus]
MPMRSLGFRGIVLLFVNNDVIGKTLCATTPASGRFAAVETRLEGEYTAGIYICAVYAFRTFASNLPTPTPSHPPLPTLNSSLTDLTPIPPQSSDLALSETL